MTADSPGNSFAIGPNSAHDWLSGVIATVRRLFETGRVPEACRTAEEAESRIGDAEPPALHLQLMGLLARGYGQSARYGECLTVSQRMAAVAEKVGDGESQLIALRFQGNAYQAIGSLGEALLVYRAALDLARQLDMKVQIPRLYNNLGGVLLALDDSVEAQRCYELALRLWENLGDVEGTIYAKTNLGRLMFQAGKLTEARSLFHSIYSTAHAHSWRQNESIAMNGIAECCFAEECYDEGLEWLENAAQLQEESCFSDLLSETQLSIAQTFSKLGRFEEADALFAKVTARAHQEQLLLVETKAYASWAESAARMEDYKRAYSLLARHQELSSQMQSQETLRRLDALRIVNQTERQRHEIDLERVRNQELASALEEAREQRAKAETANRFKSEVLHMAAHDLRNPISNVLSLVELAIDEAADSNLRQEMLSMAAASAHQTLEILSSLLDSAAIEEGRVELSPVLVELETLLSRCMSSHEATAVEKGQKLLTEGFGAHTVFADPMRLQQIVDNILSNAVKYSPRGGKIRIRIEEKGKDILCLVKDEGPGISPADMPRLFGRFQRMTHSHATGGETSTGLGLYIARTLARLSGGDLWAESEGVGKGTRFILRLPQKQGS